MLPFIFISMTVFLVIFLGIVGYYKPVAGLIGIAISVIALIPIIINPTVLLDGVETLMLELRTLSLLALILCTGFTIAGMLRNLGR